MNQQLRSVVTRVVMLLVYPQIQQDELAIVAKGEKKTHNTTISTLFISYL